MNALQFSAYYLFLRLGLLVRLSDTSLPTDILWRWNYWHRRIAPSRIRLETIDEQNFYDRNPSHNGVLGTTDLAKN